MGKALENKIPKPWYHFRNLLSRYGIDTKVLDETYCEFSQAHFFAMVDFYTLCFATPKGGAPYCKNQIISYRTDVLDPSVHLLGAFIRLAENYEIYYRFDNDVKNIQIDMNSAIHFVQDCMRNWKEGGDITC